MYPTPLHCATPPIPNFLLLGLNAGFGIQFVRYVKSTRYKIQETLFRVNFQIYIRITFAITYFVDKHDLKTYKYT